MCQTGPRSALFAPRFDAFPILELMSTACFQRERAMEEEQAVAVSGLAHAENVRANLVESSSDVLIVSEKKVKRVNDPEDLVELAKSIQTAREFVKSSATSKLSVIAEQMRLLQEQAKAVLQKAQSDEDLHCVACNLKKIPGSTYFLYKKRDSGHRYFSMIAPEEWGPRHADSSEFLGSYRYEADRSWTSQEDCDARDREMKVLEGILAHRKHFHAITD
ncbi:hypothetical protein QR680_005574 [Steinernema hermaphroditum]|uniref:Uncharacterized protein n=1 Tax=Steinernema hermaphroditum TaxID=289476 RepID=A0AA39LVM7_9BILA|nr:hypothetical protein QR680_005574 [Steinernema hermaphroditum]